MSEEYFDIYDENMNPIGVKPRKEVHKNGYWHKSFQCWFVFKEGEQDYILFQKRHRDKDTYPNLLDITSAGHLSAGESIEDGVRELEEELGIKVNYEELLPLGVIIEQKSEQGLFIDNEFANVFLYNCKKPIEDFKLQVEEVTGIFKVLIEDMIGIIEGKLEYIEAEGYEINELGEKKTSNIKLSVSSFVPHDVTYYKKVLDEAINYIN